MSAITMSTKPESAAPSLAPGGGVTDTGGPDTTLIARLAQEIWQELGPSTAPTLSHVRPAPPSTGLGGAYPEQTPDYAPPVHPATAAPAPVAQHLPVGTASGAAGADNAHPFGEPRCDAFGRPAPTAPAPHSPDFAPADSEGFASPAFYFIREPALPAVSSLPSPTAPSAAAFDVEGVRRDFPALHQQVNGKPLVWLDNAATTQKPQAVIDATAHFYARDNSNIHRAAHALAARSTDLFEGGREKVRQFLGAADAREIVFTRGTTEAINLVAHSYGQKNIGVGDEILLTRLEHHANIVPWQLLAQRTGAQIRVVPINDRGELMLEEYVKLLSPRTKIVSVTHVSNALGTINPVEQIIALAHARGVPVLVDGAQSTPHLPVNVRALDADFYVFSGHKVFGPTGIGALYGKAALLEAMPPWQGGGHMIKDVTFERTIYQHAPEKFEAGTPDIAGVVGLAAAIDYLFKVGLPGLAAYEHALLEYATQALATVPGLRPIGTARQKASVLSFVIPGVDNVKIARHLDQQGIAVRAGHHCAQPAQRHFGLESTVRPSLAFYNTHAEVDSLVAALRQLPRR
jgi:cysteine desulfurase/selenocysteine lyase